MKKYNSLPLLLLLLLNLNLFAQKGAEMCSFRKSQLPQSALEAIMSPNAPQHSFDVINYKIDLDIYNCFSNPYPKSFSATEIITFRVDSALNEIKLDAKNSSLLVTGVGLSGLSFTHSNNILTITLDQTYEPGDVVSVKIIYQHKNVSDNRFNVSNGMVFTDCEPEGARCWFPCWDKPSDKATTDITAKVPGDVKLGSNGRLQDSLVVGDTIYYHWISKDPVATYLVVLSAKVNYNLDIIYWQNLSNPNLYTPIRFYYNDGENPGPMETIFPSMVTAFSELFCEHPFEKNGFATLDQSFPWGGMENQTLTSLCPNCWDESLLAHEFAHQWFGDMITCGTWADIFLNEGFATYGGALWYEKAYGYPQYKSDVVSNANSYFVGNPGWPIYNPDWAVNTPPTDQLFNYSITYAKGACVLHMLRYVMGDSLFFQGLHDYCGDTINFKYKSAVIQDFRDRISQTYGQNLDWFFDEWLNYPNHPEYQNTYQITDIGGGSWKLSFYTKQVQTGTTFFQMPIELRVYFDGIPDTTIRVMNDVNNQVFTFYFQHQPSQLVFDPDNEIVLKQDVTTVGLPEFVTEAAEVSLSQNTPNPASGSTMIQYTLPTESDIWLSLHDVTGKELKVMESTRKQAGIHQYIMETKTLVPGLYFYTLKVGNQSMSRKIIVN